MGKRMFAIAMALAMIVVLALPMAVGAAGSGNDTTGVNGSIGATFSIDSPSAAVAFGTFSSAQPYQSSAMTITASTNSSSTTVDVTVKDAKTNNPGYLTLAGADSSGATKLTNPLQVKGGADQSTYTNLLGSSGVTLASAENLTSGSYSFNDFYAGQNIETADLSKTSGSYSLTMTFTATFN